MIRIMLIPALLLCNVFAEVPNETYKKIESLLKEQISQKNFERAFVQKKNIKRLNISIESKGTIKVYEEGITWKITSPSLLVLKIEKASIQFEEVALDGQVTVKKIDRSKINNANLSYVEDLYAILNKNWEKINSRYSLREIDKLQKTIDFVPKENLSQFTNIRLKLNSQNDLEEVFLNEKNGDSILIKFFKISQEEF